MRPLPRFTRGTAPTQQRARAPTKRAPQARREALAATVSRVTAAMALPTGYDVRRTRIDGASRIAAAATASRARLAGYRHPGRSPSTISGPAPDLWDVAGGSGRPLQLQALIYKERRGQWWSARVLRDVRQDRDPEQRPASAEIVLFVLEGGNTGRRLRAPDLSPAGHDGRLLQVVREVPEIYVAICFCWKA